MFTNWITCFASGASVIWIATKLVTQKQYWVHDFHRVWMKSEYFFKSFKKSFECVFTLNCFLFICNSRYSNVYPCWRRMNTSCPSSLCPYWTHAVVFTKKWLSGICERAEKSKTKATHQRESVWCNTFL